MRKSDEQREAICARVEYWAQRLHVRPRLVRVQRMTQKWGSCSTSGIVTFATDLVKQEVGFQDFVIAHELLHLRVPQPWKTLQGGDDGAHSRLEKARRTPASRLSYWLSTRGKRPPEPTNHYLLGFPRLLSS